jgi:hypothetical protein
MIVHYILAIVYMWSLQNNAYICYGVSYSIKNVTDGFECTIDRRCTRRSCSALAIQRSPLISMLCAQHYNSHEQCGSLVYVHLLLRC